MRLAQSLDGLKEMHPAHYGTAKVPSYREKVEIKACSDCGWGEHPAVLEVHHLDGDRSNNQVSNLVVLCPTHHKVRHYLSGTGKWSKKPVLVV